MRETARETKPQDIRIAGFMKRSAVNGPGVRSVIWVQGCPIRCGGCFNPYLWDYHGGNAVSTDHLFDMIVSIEGIAGVTFSGGEPFAQARALAELGSRVHDRNLTVVTFTGFSYDHLKAKKRSSWQHLLDETDLLVSGPFVREFRPIHPLAGSGNQEVRLLSDRICMEPAGSASIDIEFVITPAGSLSMTGFPGEDLMRQLAETGFSRGR